MCKTAANLALLFPLGSQEVQTTRKEGAGGEVVMDGEREVMNI
jgi:hypothetical protein